jgi:hypothetical protein
MLATERDATFFAASGEKEEVLGCPRLETQKQQKSLHRGLLVAFSVLVGGLLLLAAVVLPPVFREATYLVEKLRYTSICVRCGEQRSSVFYLLLGTEIVRSERALPISTRTLFNQKMHEHSDHDSVLIGKAMFGITKAFGVNESLSGTPYGWDFEGMDLAKTLSELKGMRVGAVLGHMQALVQARERGQSASTGLLTGEI